MEQVLLEGGPAPPPARSHMRLMNRMYGMIVSDESFERGPTPPLSRTHMRLKEQKNTEQVYLVH